MTPREQALAAYFYTISTDPRVRAAGYSPSKFKDALLACVAEDVGAVIAMALRGAAAKTAPVVSQAAKNVATTMLGGVVSEKAQGEIGSGLETLVHDGLKWLGQKVVESTKPRKVS